MGKYAVSDKAGGKQRKSVDKNAKSLGDWKNLGKERQKIECGIRNLSTTGTKDELGRRLYSYCRFGYEGNGTVVARSMGLEGDVLRRWKRNNVSDDDDEDVSSDSARGDVRSELAADDRSSMAHGGEELDDAILDGACRDNSGSESSDAFDSFCRRIQTRGKNRAYTEKPPPPPPSKHKSV